MLGSCFNFGGVSKVPTKFKPTCHIFYGMRVIDINDDLPKWSGHKNQSLRSRLMDLEGLNWFALKKCISLESFQSTKVFIF
jgi:hypothetical protein